MENRNEIRLHVQTDVIPVTTHNAIPEAGAKPLRIIVADDSATFIEVVCALLEMDGSIDIIGRACDGAAAIEAVAKLHPDALLMDIDMPVLDGLNAALIIAAWLPCIRIVLMSAEETPEICRHARAWGAASFIHKSRFREEFRAALGLQ